MTSLPASPLHYDVVFCDSIRQENNGKFILIGIYAKEMIVPAFPYIAAEFFVQTKLSAHVDSPEVPIGVHISAPGVMEEHVAIDFEGAKRHPSVRDGVVSIDATRRFSPLVVPEPTSIRVALETSAGKREIGSLRILSAPAYAAEFADKQIYAPALAFFANYLDSFLALAREGANQRDVDRATMEVFETLFAGRSDFRLNDPSQPVWVVVGSRSLWVLYTQAWHQNARIELIRSGTPVKHREVKRNLIGRFLELEPAEGYVSTADLVAVATAAVTA